jgi:hypothetical protein
VSGRIVIGKEVRSQERSTRPAFEQTSDTSTILQANHLLTIPANSSLHQNAAAAPTTGALIIVIVPTILDNAKYHMNP